MSYHLPYLSAFVLVIIILQSQLDFSHIQKQKWIDYCKYDLRLCDDCFSLENGTKLTEEACDKIFDDYEFEDQSFVNMFNSLFGDRDIEFVSSRSQSKQIVIKRIADKDVIETVLKDLGIDKLDGKKDIAMLKQNFLDENRVGGSYICHANMTIEKFYQTLPVKLKPEKLFWMLMNFNVQPLIFSAFDIYHDLPIPKQLALIGLTSVTENKGESLVQYISTSFKTRIRISRLLFESVLKFTNATYFKGFRIYLTDLTLDNIVYNPARDAISFVDLDNIILIDSLFFSHLKSNEMHIHEKFECNGCFAYSIDDICNYSTSDINVFAVCQLLYEDLYEDQSKGFLHLEPNEMKKGHAKVLDELEKCVNCKQRNCDRFKSASKLIEMFDLFLKDD